VVSRAVAPLKDLWRWSKPLLKGQLASDSYRDSGQHKSGLICLKGGDLAAEVQESATKPRVTEIKDLFNEESFIDKYVLYVPK